MKGRGLGRVTFWGCMLFLFLFSGCSSDVMKSKSVRQTVMNSNNIVLDRAGERLYTANLDANTISIVDVKSRKVLQDIPVGKEPRQLTLSPDERQLYVSCMFEDQVDVVDLKKAKVIDSVKVGHEPYGLLTSQDGQKLYVANTRSSTVSVIDIPDRKLIQSIPVEDYPRSLSMTADGSKMYISHYLPGKISVFNPQNEKVIKTIDLSPSPDQKDAKKSQGIPNTLEQMNVSPDGKTAWISHLLTNIDTPIHFQETIFPALSLIDTENDVELVEQRKELFNGINVQDVHNQPMIVSNPYGVAFLPDGSKVYSIMSGSEDLVVFDMVRGGNATQILRRIPGDNPRGIVISPDGMELYIHNAMSHDLVIIRTNADDPYGEASVDGTPIKLINKDPLSPLVRRGKTIFYSANSDESTITGNNWMSCASCHSDGYVNGLTFTTPKGPRNTPSNVLTTKTGLFMWDGSRDDFEDYILTVQGEMGGMMEDDAGKPLSKKNKEIFEALEAYLDQPDSFPIPKSPYRNEDGSFTAKAEEGKALFEGKAGCLECHAGDYFTDSVKAVDGHGVLTTDIQNYLYDVGTVSPLDKGTEGDPRAAFTNPREPEIFDVPTLRGVWATAPYLHDGSAKTILDVLTTRNPQGKHGNVSQLTKKELEALADYVNSIE